VAAAPGGPAGGGRLAAAESEQPFDVFSDPQGEDFSLGVEEEFLLVDAATRTPRADADVVIGAITAPPGTAIGAELKRSQLETGSAVCRDLPELRASLAGLRGALAGSAEAVGARIAAMGTHPFARWTDDGGVTPGADYADLRATYGLLTVEQTVCGCHVHVGVRDPELAVEVMNRARAWVPLLVALSANSPYWMGHDSGYASFRTQVFHRWPTAGIPEHFEDRAAYERVVADLAATSAIDAPARLYWDVRPSARYPTLEFRACDVLTTVEEAVVVAAVIRAIVETCHGEAVAERPYERPRPELLRAALWRASRFGLAAELIDVDAKRLLPATALVGKLLERIGPSLDARGDIEAVVSTLSLLLRRGTGARRQREARSGDPTERGLWPVVDRVAAATTADLS
jgi:carboxylate-amine ligase